MPKKFSPMEKLQEEKIKLLKKEQEKHEKLPYYKVFTVKYLPNGTVLNSEELRKFSESYYLTNQLASRTTNNDLQADFFCEKRPMPVQFGLVPHNTGNV